MKKIFFFVLLCTILFVGCSPSDSEQAQALVEEASHLVNNGQWRQARIVMDSLHLTFPKEIAQRRVAKALEDSITYLEAQQTLAYTDTLLPPLIEQADQLIKQFKYEKNENYENHGKYVHRLLNTGSNTSRNFLQAYVLDNRQTVVKSYYYGNIQVNQQSVVLQSEGEDVTFYGRNHHFQDGAHHEIMTLEDEDALALLNYIDTHRKHRIRVEGKGDTPTHNWVYYLNDKEKQALSATYQLGWLMKDIKRIEDIQRTASAQIERYQQKRNK